MTSVAAPVLEPLLKVEQVATLLALKPSTIRAYCERDKMPHIRIGGQLRFRSGEVLEWIEQHARRPRARRKRTKPVAS